MFCNAFFFVTNNTKKQIKISSVSSTNEVDVWNAWEIYWSIIMCEKLTLVEFSTFDNMSLFGCGFLSLVSISLPRCEIQRNYPSQKPPNIVLPGKAGLPIADWINTCITYYVGAPSSLPLWWSKMTLLKVGTKNQSGSLNHKLMVQIYCLWYQFSRWALSIKR